MDNNSPFLKVPTEIRLAIYKLLLVGHENKSLRIGHENPVLYDSRRGEQRKRRKFTFIADRDRSGAGPSESTYFLIETPYRKLHTAILGVNHQVHAEAAHVLYHEHRFDFGMDMESIIPFLEDLTPVALSSIRWMRLVKRSLYYTKDFDRCEWRNACKFIAESMRAGKMRLQQLDLDIYGWTPSLANKPALHWKQIHVYTKSDFELISKLEDMEEDMEWVRHVGAIKGLQVLNVKALLEYWRIPDSKKMAFFVNFSASIEKGFTEYLKSLMLVSAS